MASLRKRGKTWYYRVTDADGAKRERKGCSDKQATASMAAHAEAEAAKVRAGYVDPKAPRYQAHESRPLADHMAEYRNALTDKGDGATHAKKTEYRAGRVCALAGWRRVSDLNLSGAVGALATLRSEGLGQGTLNRYVWSIKSFSRWLWRDGRAREHALAHLATASSEADRRHTRRALSPDAAALLIRAAEAGPVVKGMTGPDRAVLYRVALATGLRASELRSLTPASFRLGGTPPVVVCEAGSTKNGRKAEQPISGSLADLLRPFLAGRGDGPVFALNARTADMIRADLLAAGIPYETDSGVVDFHALRASFVTHLVASGASVKTAQVLARHSTPTLTIGVYAKASVHDLTGAVEALPDLTGKPDRTEGAALADTGTDGAPIKNLRAHHLPTGGDGSGHLLAVTGGTTPEVLPASRPPEVLTLSASGGSGRLESSMVGTAGGGRHDGPKGTSRTWHGAGIANPGKGLRQSNVHPAHPLPTDTRPTPPDLAAVVAAWPDLPEAIRAGIVAMVRATGKAGGR